MQNLEITRRKFNSQLKQSIGGEKVYNRLIIDQLSRGERMLDKETFLESLKSQYRDDIHMLITECQHDGKTYLDVEMLNENLAKIHSYAVSSGLTEDDWLTLIYELTPEIYNKIDMTYQIAA